MMRTGQGRTSDPYLDFGLFGVPRGLSEQVTENRRFDQSSCSEAADALELLGYYQWVKSAVFIIIAVGWMMLGDAFTSADSFWRDAARTLTVAIVLWLPIYMIMLGCVRLRLKRREENAPVAESPNLLRILRIAPSLAFSTALLLAYPLRP